MLTHFSKAFQSYNIKLLKMMMSSSTDGQALDSLLRSIVPPLSSNLHKGQCGRIGIIGGCKEYTGAPYFAAISALKVGADLSHVICTAEASPVIKGYSPELIVHPILDADDAVAQISEWLPRLHTLVIGPGLGREPTLAVTLQGIIEKAKELDINLVIDADGLHFVTLKPDLVANNTKVTLTPNIMEFSRLCQKMGLQSDGNQPDTLCKMCVKLGHITIVLKGKHDLISDGKNTLVCDTPGSERRCGGQGDLLSGSIGTFTHWASWAQQRGCNNAFLNNFGANISAAYAGCYLTRQCSKAAFQKHHRSMTTTDMIEQIPNVFYNQFELSKY